MPILLLESQAYSINPLNKSVMLLEYNNCLIRDRISQTNQTISTEHEPKLESKSSKSIKMTTPSTTTSKYKASATTDTNKATTIDVAALYMQQQHHLHSQHQLHQQQQHQQNLFMQQHLLQQNMLTAVTSTSPLQHLNNIFGLNFNTSPPPHSPVPPPAAVNNTMPLSASTIFHVNNNLQHLLTGIPPQQQQQFQQLYQEFYDNMLPQHYHEQKMLRDLIQATSTAQTDILPVNSSTMMIKPEAAAIMTSNSPPPSTTPLAATSTMVSNSPAITPLETFGNVTAAAAATAATGADDAVDCDAGNIGGVALNHKDDDCSNMASLERQHNESTHANQTRHQQHHHHRSQTQYLLLHHQQQQHLGNNKVPRASQPSATTTTTDIISQPTARVTPPTSSATISVVSASSAFNIKTTAAVDVSEADIKCGVGVGGTVDIGGGSTSSMTSMTPVSETSASETSTAVKLGE